MTYSQDLRERAIAAIEKGEKSHAEIAEDFKIHESTLDKWWARYQMTGSFAAWPATGGPPRSLQVCESVIRSALKKQPDATLAELCEGVQASHNISASPSMMSRELKLLDLPRKKSRSPIASGRRRA
jgi:transposase